MIKYITLILIFFSVNVTFAQFDWIRLNYSHSTGSNSDNSRKYYTIDIDTDGKGKLEYFADSKVNTLEFNLSKRNLYHINSILKTSGIFIINPKEIASGNQENTGSIYTMTLTLDREFGEKYEYKLDRSKFPKKKGKNEEDEEEEGEKNQVIPIPNNLKDEYKKQFYNLYYKIEMMVPNRIWKEAEEVLN